MELLGEGRPYSVARKLGSLPGAGLRNPVAGPQVVKAGSKW